MKSGSDILKELTDRDIWESIEMIECPEDCPGLVKTEDMYGTGDSPTEYSHGVLCRPERCPIVEERK